jgi:sterol desaturase/sphingolipid hydroxylase (fatty acid hydroxylase superfamily)
VIALLGAPAIAVLISESVYLLAALFAHANLALPPAIDHRLRAVLVTPDLHRVHHSVDPEESDTNFGVVVPWWDRLFGTYRDRPALGHQGMSIGLHDIRDRRSVSIPWLLAMPLFAGARAGTAATAADPATRPGAPRGSDETAAARSRADGA